MTSPKMNRILREILLPGLIVACALGVLGSWTYALMLNVKVRSALKVDLPAPVKKAEPAKATPTPGQPVNVPGQPAGMPGRPGQNGPPVPPGAVTPPPGSPAGASATPAMPPAMPKELEELVKAKSLFGRQPDTSGNASVQGVLGDSALVNGQWMKIGQPNGNIVVKEINGNKVVLEVNGQRRETTVWPQMPGT